MAHKTGRSPSTMAKNIPNQLTSRSVIRTTMKKTGGKADRFVYKGRGCGHIQGSPGTAMLD